MTAPGAGTAARAHTGPPGLRLVRRRSRDLVRRALPRGFTALTIVGAIVVTTVVFGVLLEQVVLGQSAFKLAELRREVARAEARHEELLLEAAKLESPDRIEAVARDELGMVEPTHVEYIVADVRTGAIGRRAGPGRASRLAASGLAFGRPTERSP